MTTHQVSLDALRTRRVETAAHPQAGAYAFAQPDRPEPWRPRHLAVSLAVAVIGTIGMAVCWYAGAGQLAYRDQVPWLIGSIASAGLTVVGGVVWLVCGVREVSLLERDLIGYLGPWLARAGAVPAEPATAQPAGSLVIAPGMTWAHRPDCLLVRGKAAVVPITETDIAGRLPTCRVCGS